MIFNGVDVLLQNAAPDALILSGVSSVLGLAPERVRLIDDISNYPPSDDVDAVCLVSSVHGDFQRLVAIDARPIEVPFADQSSLVAAFAAAIGCNCAIPDASPNPFTFLLGRPDGLVERRGMQSVPTEDDTFLLL